MKSIKKAELTLKNCLAIKRSDRVLVLCDRNTLPIGQTFFDASEKVTMSPLLIEMPITDHHGMEPPNTVADAMIHSDVIIAPTTYSLTYTNATRAALARGARIVTMPGITMEMLREGGLDADYPRIAKAIKKFGRKFQRAKDIRLTTKWGTEIEASVEGRKWILDDNGLCNRRGMITNLPAGKVFIAPIESSINGRLVIDGVFLPRIKGEVSMDIKKGVAENIEGPEEILDLLERSRCGRTICEIGIGMNPKARVTGNMLEDQKALGTVHVGFGDNTTFGGEVNCDMHNDGMLPEPTLEIDRQTVIEDGTFILDN
jgi:leucyl aminopeptidase (aminopeptidase T)/ribosomal protein L36